MGAELFHADGQKNALKDGRAWRNLKPLTAILQTHLKYFFPLKHLNISAHSNSPVTFLRQDKS
jgi:hypothetical protein